MARWPDAVQADPTCQTALGSLRDDALEGGRWDVALQIAEAELGLDLLPRDRGQLHAVVGQLWLEHFDDPELAIWHRRFREGTTRYVEEHQGQVVNPNNPFSFSFSNTGIGGWTSYSSSLAPSESYLRRNRARAIVCLLQSGDRERVVRFALRAGEGA